MDLSVAAKLIAPQDSTHDVVFGTAASTSPLLIVLDGDTDPTPATGTSSLAVGDRVVCLIVRRRLIALTAVNATPSTHPLTLSGASGAAYVQVHGGRAYLHLDFTVGATALSNGHHLTTLPVGTRPAAELYGTGATLAGLAARLIVHPTGEITVRNPQLPANAAVTYAPMSWAV